MVPFHRNFSTQVQYCCVEVVPLNSIQLLKVQYWKIAQLNWNLHKLMQSYYSACIRMYSSKLCLAGVPSLAILPMNITGDCILTMKQRLERKKTFNSLY